MENRRKADTAIAKANRIAYEKVYGPSKRSKSSKITKMEAPLTEQDENRLFVRSMALAYLEGRIRGSVEMAECKRSYPDAFEREETHENQA